MCFHASAAKFAFLTRTDRSLARSLALSIVCEHLIVTGACTPVYTCACIRRSSVLVMSNFLCNDALAKDIMGRNVHAMLQILYTHFVIYFHAGLFTKRILFHDIPIVKLYYFFWIKNQIFIIMFLTDLFKILIL